MSIGFRWLEGPVDIREYPEAATQSYKAGDPVYLVAGKVTISDTDQHIWGIALADATGVTDTKTLVHVVHPDQVWVAQSDDATAQANVGNNYGLNLSAGACTIDVGDTTTVTVAVQNIDPAFALGTSGGFLWVRFIPAVCLSQLGL